MVEVEKGGGIALFWHSQECKHLLFHFESTDILSTLSLSLFLYERACVCVSLHIYSTYAFFGLVPPQLAVLLNVEEQKNLDWQLPSLLLRLHKVQSDCIIRRKQEGKLQVKSLTPSAKWLCLENLKQSSGISVACQKDYLGIALKPGFRKGCV